MPDYGWAFVVALAAAFIVTPGVIWLAFKTGALDEPEARKVHKKPVPRIGGLGIYIAFMVSMGLYLTTAELPGDVRQGMEGLMIGGTLIVALGLADDYLNIPAKLKLLGQIACAAPAPAGGGRRQHPERPPGRHRGRPDEGPRPMGSGCPQAYRRHLSRALAQQLPDEALPLETARPSRGGRPVRDDGNGVQGVVALRGGRP